MASHLPRLALVVLAALACRPATAQAPSLLIPELDGPINGMAIVGDTLYFAGAFQTVGARVGPATALDLATGAVVPGVVPAIDLYYGNGDAIRAVVPDGQGGVYLAGDIRQVAGAPLRDLIHVLPDGTVDTAFAPGPIQGPNGDPAGVRTLSLSDGVLFLEGYVASVGGAARDGFAAIDAATGAVLPFNPSVSDASGYGGVQSAHLHDGVVLVAGYFDAAEGQPRHNMAAFDFATGALLAWQAGMDAAGSVTHLVPTDQTLYVVGRFSQFGGAPRRGLAEISYPTADVAGPTLTPWAPKLASPAGDPATATVRGVTLTPTHLWFAGGFAGANSYPYGRSAPLLRVSRTTGTLAGEAVLEQSYNPSSLLVVDAGPIATDGETVWASVGETQNRQSTNGYVIGLDAETLLPTSFRVNTGPLRSSGGSAEGLTPHVKAMAVVDGRLVVAGRRLELGGVRAPYFGGIDLTTGVLLPSPSAFPKPVSDLIPSPDGRRLYMREEEPLQGAPKRYVELDLVTGAQTRFSIPFEGRGAVRDSSAAPARGPVRYTAHPSVPMIATAERLYLLSGPGRYSNSHLFAVDPFTLRTLPGFDARTEPTMRDAQLQDGWIYVSGSFETVNGPQHLFYARFSPQTGEEDLTWNPVATYYGGTSGGPMAFAEGLMVTGGRGLKRINTVNTVGGFAAFSRPSGEWRPWNGWIPEGVTVDTRAFQYGDGVFYTSGYLGQRNGENQYLTAFDRDGNRLNWPASQPRHLSRNLLVSARHHRVFVTTNEDQGRYSLYSLPMLGGYTPPTEAAEAPAPSAATLSVFPNPARGAARLTVALPEPSASVRIELIDALGRRVATLHDGPLPAGRTEISVDAAALPPGIYVARAVGASATASVRMIVVR